MQVMFYKTYKNVNVFKYSCLWETAATFSCARRRKTLWHPQGRRGAGTYRGGRPPTACFGQQVGRPSSRQSVVITASKRAGRFPFLIYDYMYNTSVFTIVPCPP